MNYKQFFVTQYIRNTNYETLKNIWSIRITNCQEVTDTLNKTCLNFAKFLMFLVSGGDSRTFIKWLILSKT